MMFVTGSADASERDKAMRWTRILTVGLALALGASVFGCGHTSPRSRQVNAGERVALASGLSLVMPAGGGEFFAHDRSEGVGVDQVLFGQGQPPSWLKHIAIQSFADFSQYDPLLVYQKDARVIARSTDGSVVMYWVPGGFRTFAVLTHLPGKDYGWIVDDDAFKFKTAKSAWREAASLWRRLSIRGAQLPPLREGST
jgi:hypothetical protein